MMTSTIRKNARKSNSTYLKNFKYLYAIVQRHYTIKSENHMYSHRALTFISQYRIKKDLVSNSVLLFKIFYPLVREQDILDPSQAAV